MTATDRINRLIILTGPSCSGKTPLVKAFKIHYPKAAVSLQQIIPYTTRVPRPGEIEGTAYHFVESHEFLSLRAKASIIEIRVRGDRQAVDTSRIGEYLFRFTH